MSEIELKDYIIETNLVQARLLSLGVVMMILVVLLGARAWYLQIYQHDQFDVLSSDNRVRVVAVPPVRGQIYDRKGRILAENKPVFTLEVIPDQVRNLSQLLDQLAKVVLLSPQQIEQFRATVRARRGFESLVLRVGLSDEEVARFLVNQHRLAGAQVHARLQRAYPYAGEMAHVLGYVGRINQREKNRLDPQRYKGTDYVGKLGIEAFYEDQLLGDVGYEQVETNAHGRAIRTLERVDPVSGEDLVLNIDAELQIKARALLGERRGSVVAIDPHSGGVLAFVSNPVFDPNQFVNGIDHRSYNALRDDPYKPLLNRALYGRYAPGSTIKGLVSLAGMENGWSPNQTVNCPGYYRLPGASHRYRCWRRQGHGLTNLIESIQKSCDVFYYALAQRLGIDTLHAFLSGFGLGQKTGIDLHTEPSGLMPSRDWKRSVRGTIWYPGETLIAGIGQGYTLTTPLQLGVLAATMANGGTRLAPRLVNRTSTDIEDTHEASSTIEPIRLETQPQFDPKHFDVMVEGMRAVVEEERGTAYPYIGRDLTYAMAGKTGTAQVVAIAQGAEYDETILSEFQKDHALFVGFAPLDDPKIAVAVVIDNGGSGSSEAAPVARGVMDHYLLESGLVATAPW